MPVWNPVWLFASTDNRRIDIGREIVWTVSVTKKFYKKVYYSNNARNNLLVQRLVLSPSSMSSSSWALTEINASGVSSSWFWSTFFLLWNHLKFSSKTKLQKIFLRKWTQRLEVKISHAWTLKKLNRKFDIRWRPLTETSMDKVCLKIDYSSKMPCSEFKNPSKMSALGLKPLA